MKKYYECHITMEMENKGLAERAVKATGWSFSAIDGDPILGKGVKCYATKHFPERKPEEEVLKELNAVGNELADHGINVVRRKIELVLYDTRSQA